PERPRLRVRMGFPVELGDRTEYHRVRLEWRGEELWASSTGVQFSSRLLSLTGAHALVHIPSGQGQRLVGAIAEALILQLP
ncbi:MAG: gephyrin-like molybdotransferase Glp, partial [Candidatus Dormibacteraceae bacterium]